jgi:tetratricopeptide (TPR) repeat protein
VALAVLAAALFIRAAYLLHIQALPTFDYPVMDAAYHDNWAREVASGKIMQDEPFFRAPAYPYLLGLIYRLTGGSYLAPRILQFLLGALSALLTFALARRLLGLLAAALSGLMVALYPILIYFEGELLTETLFTFFIMLSLYALVAASKRRSALLWFAGGISAGAALITRPTAAVFIPFAALGAVLFGRRRVLYPIVVLAGVVIMMLPVTAHNFAVSGEFIPLVWQGGLNFYLGNNPGADGWSATSPELRKDWWGGYKDMVAIPREELGREPSFTEVSDYWTDRALVYIESDPYDWIKLMLKKVALFWGSREFPNNLDFNFMKIRSWVLRDPVFTFATVAPLAIVGLIVLAPRIKGLYFLYSFLLAFFAVTIAFFVCSRYRAPAVPVMTIFAGGAVAWLVDAMRKRKALRVAAFLAAAGAAAVLVNLNLAGERLPGPAQSYTVLANVYREKGNREEAARYYQAAVDENPGWAEGYEGLALLAMEEADTAAAREYLLHALTAEPRRATAYRALAMLYVSEDDLRDARDAIDNAIRYAPYLENNYNILGTIERREGNAGRAVQMFRKEIELNPGNWRAYANLASLYDETGRLEEAIVNYQRAVELNPGQDELLFALAAAYAADGQDEKAMAILGRLGDREHGDPTLLYNRAVLLQEQGEIEQAQLLYEEVLSLQPRHEGALVNLGVVYARQGRDEEAIALWQRALEVNPSNANARSNIELLRRRMESPG